jgi:hypothetical protein
MVVLKVMRVVRDRLENEWILGTQENISLEVEPKIVDLLFVAPNYCAGEDG